MCISPVWGSPSGETQSDLPTTVVCTVSNADGSALRERLARGEQPKVTLHAEVDTGWRQTPILVAEIDGPDADGPFILYSGHHDTWYYGVMDNGAANATMLEVARLSARERDEVAARPAAVLLVGPFAWPLFRLDLVCRSALGRAGTALRGARERRFHRRHRRHRAEERRRGAGADRAGRRGDRRAGRLGLCRQAHVALVGPVVLGHRHSGDVRRTERAAAGAGEDAQCAGLVVAHAGRSARQDRRGDLVRDTRVFVHTSGGC